MSIRLHKELGVNPRMTFCPRCGGEAQELVLLGTANYVGDCREHGKVYGALAGGRCPIEKYGNTLHDHRQLKPSERVPAHDICDECKKALRVQQEAIDAGGLAWRCTCGSEGGILLNENTADFVKAVREKGALGVQFDGDCPVCRQREEEANGKSGDTDI